MTQTYKGYNEIFAEAKSLYVQYRDLGFSRHEARERTRADLNKRYAKDGRILNIVYWVLKFMLLFILI